MMRSESSNYKLGRLDKVLVLKFVLTPTDPDTEFKMVRGRTIKTVYLKTYQDLNDHLYQKYREAEWRNMSSPMCASSRYSRLCIKMTHFLFVFVEFHFRFGGLVSFPV